MLHAHRETCVTPRAVGRNGPDDVPSKEDLVLHMADAAFGEESYRADAPEDWRTRIELGGRTLWSLYRKHPWLAQLGSLTRPLLVPNLMVHGEWMLGAFEDGYDLRLDALFEFGLKALLDGLTSIVEGQEAVA